MVAFDPGYIPQIFRWMQCWRHLQQCYNGWHLLQGIGQEALRNSIALVICITWYQYVYLFPQQKKVFLVPFIPCIAHAWPLYVIWQSTALLSMKMSCFGSYVPIWVVNMDCFSTLHSSAVWESWSISQCLTYIADWFHIPFSWYSHPSPMFPILPMFLPQLHGFWSVLAIVHPNTHLVCYLEFCRYAVNCQ